MQYKGWSYQLQPALLTASVALGLSLFARAPVRAGVRAGAIVAASLVLVYTMVAYRQMPRASNIANTNLAPVVLALSLAKQGSYCYVFTTNMTPAFPTVVLMDLKWASRFPTLWPLPALAKREARSDETQTRALTSWVSEDFERYQPSVVLVDKQNRIVRRLVEQPRREIASFG